MQAKIHNFLKFPSFFTKPQFFSTLGLIKTLEKSGLSPKILTSINQNPQILSNFEEIFKYFPSKTLNKTQANLLYNLAQKLPNEPSDLLSRFSGYILNGKIQDVNHLDKILQNLKVEITQKGIIQDWNAFEQRMGLNVEYNECHLRECVKGILSKYKGMLGQLGCNKNNVICGLLRGIRNELPGASSQAIFEIFNEEIKNVNETNSTINDNKTDNSIDKTMKTSSSVHIWDKLKDLNTARDLVLANNSPDNFSKHWETTHGRIFLRFPPEPNGFLHIGHAKAIRANFQSAVNLHGLCNLRYDDTNPEKESHEYIENIEKSIYWLGYKPDKITYASDYFSEIYEFALKLIKDDKAYICEQSKPELQSFRKDKKSSPYRERSKEESLAIFQGMKDGLYKEGTYCLRLKIDPAHKNPTMRDPVIYRIKDHPHPKTGELWRIYPTYDFTHCISDSIENISHSLCTLEFEIRRDLYYWILDALSIFKPVVWEYSRLNISHTVLSKRKLAVLVKENLVEGWDDPRLLTLEGLKRRGYTPASINEFCDMINVTRRGNENIISIQLLEHCLRKELDKTAYRLMTVIDPVLVIIDNFNEEEIKKINIPIHPKDASKGFREVLLKKRIFIERKDIRLKDEKDFFGITLDKIVCLKYAGFIKCIKIEKNSENNEILQIHANFINSNENNNKTKGVIHWIAEDESLECEIRLFEYLFKIENANELDDFKSGINENSKKIIKKSKMHKEIKGNEAGHYQFERIGYFVIDKDSMVNEKKFVFNMAVGLKEKNGKSKVCSTE